MCVLMYILSVHVCGSSGPEGTGNCKLSEMGAGKWTLAHQLLTVKVSLQTCPPVSKMDQERWNTPSVVDQWWKSFICCVLKSVLWKSLHRFPGFFHFTILSGWWLMRCSGSSGRLYQQWEDGVLVFSCFLVCLFACFCQSWFRSWIMDRYL